MMRCFSVVFELSEPVIAPFSIALDGLLAAASVMDGQHYSEAHLKLPIKRTDDVYHTSQLYFVGPSQSFPVPYVRSLKPEQWDRGVFRDGRGNPRRKVVVRDELKNLLDKYQAIATPAAVAWGVGDIEHVSQLLQHINGLGKKALSRSYGRINKFSVEPTDGNSEIHGLLDAERYPVRNLPIRLFEKLNGKPDSPTGAAVWRLPRWQHPPEHCALPVSRFIRPEDIP